MALAFQVTCRAGRLWKIASGQLFIISHCFNLTGKYIQCIFPVCSEKPISEARASVMLYSYEREKWEDCGDAWVQVYHHLVNNTYRIVGTKFEDESVCLQQINVSKRFFRFTFDQLV